MSWIKIQLYVCLALLLSFGLKGSLMGQADPGGCFKTGTAYSKCADSNWSGAKISDTKVRQRIHRWGGASYFSGYSSTSVHYEAGKGQLAYTYTCSGISTLITQAEDAGNSVAGIRAYFGMTQNPCPQPPCTTSSEETFQYLCLILVAVDASGNDIIPSTPAEGAKPCLGYNTGSSIVPVSQNACLNLSTTNSNLPGDGAAGWISKSKAQNFTKNFRDYLKNMNTVDGTTTGSWCNASEGFKCPLSGCKDKGGFWYSSYTYCIEFVNYLLGQTDGEDQVDGLRFYFGTRVDGGNYQEHTSAMVAVQKSGSDYVDFCDSSNTAGIYFIDWGTPCPTLCGNNLSGLGPDCNQ